MTFTGKRYSASEPDPRAHINPRTGQQVGEISYTPMKRCDFCGNRVNMDTLDEHNACPDCHQEPEWKDR